VAELADVVEDLVRANPWSMHDATMYVLCGTTPTAPLTRTALAGTWVNGWRRNVRDVAPENDHVRITLTVHPDLLGSDVQRLYAAAHRGRRVPRRVFMMARFLTRFDSEQPDVSTREQMAAWNASDENDWRWRVSSVSTFRAQRAEARRFLK
jgi:hypothetical protein